ncbi:hypothetical protein BD293_4670 [Roseinatronobacter monicus]|uniref:Uncharacterized protein n=1 Tax=Roseinatronobacter monicus TaxID=393481 RepID=A0A543K3G7_9RHOB|nr:hypothetical protein BD293_4670 [Roseinatronobacter monicus]
MSAAYSVNPAAGAGTMPQHLRRPPAPCAGASNDALGPLRSVSVGGTLQCGFTKPANRASRSIFCY